jgi:DNA-binding transcriptional LysR family regulator
VELEIPAAITTDDYAVAREAVCAGGGIGLLPVAMCQDAVKRRELQRVLGKYVARGSPIFLLSPPLNRLPQRVLLFRTFLIENLAVLPPCGDIAQRKNRPSRGSQSARLTT